MPLAGIPQVKRGLASSTIPELAATYRLNFSAGVFDGCSNRALPVLCRRE
jgi:hypothetical protein